MDIDRDALVAEILAAQEALGRVGSAAMNNAWQNLDLTMTQLKVLFVLAHSQAMTISEVADALHVGRPAASVLVDRLVQLDLAERREDREDRRRMVVTLSEQGQQLMDRLRRGGEALWLAWLARISDADLRALAQGVRALAQAAEVESSS